VAGRPKPTQLKILTGNPGKRPLNRNEPKPARNLPDPPDELNEDARIEWDRISRELYLLGLLTSIDRSGLAAYCQAYGRWMIAERAVNEAASRDPRFHGLLVLTTNGNIIQNPMVGAANRAMADMMRYAVEFGLTPSSRSRVRVEGVKDEDEAEKYFKAG
jgi:P27 family predicted phage terminase small subunit